MDGCVTGRYERPGLLHSRNKKYIGKPDICSRACPYSTGIGREEREEKGEMRRERGREQRRERGYLERKLEDLHKKAPLIL